MWAKGTFCQYAWAQSFQAEANYVTLTRPMNLFALALWAKYAWGSDGPFISPPSSGFRVGLGQRVT